MGVIRTGPGRARLGYSPGSFLTRLIGQNVVTSAWPRARNRRLSLFALSLRERFAAIVNTVKYLSPLETNQMRDALRQWNREHTGLAGTATIRPEDMDHARLSGRLFGYVLPGGQLSIHIDALYDVTAYLDWLEPKAGSMVTRTAQGWRCTDPCQPDAYFTLTPDINLPSCCEDAQLWPPSEVPPP